jgi:hypothetical protein
VEASGERPVLDEKLDLEGGNEDLAECANHQLVLADREGPHVRSPETKAATA